MAVLKALVLAAGEGTRLRPLTLDRPKPMLPIGGRPMLEHTLALLKQHGVRDVAINLHHKSEVITSYFSRFSDMNIVYSHEAEILGTAGAAKKLAHFLDSTFFVIYGDVLTDLDLSALLAYHRAKDAAITIVLYEVEDPTRCGIVEVDRSGRVGSFVEKPSAPKSNLANAGIYVVEPSVLSHIPGGFADFGFDVFPALIAANAAFYAFPIHSDTYLLDIGSLERYAQACRDAEEGRICLLHLESPQD